MNRTAIATASLLALVAGAVALCSHRAPLGTPDTVAVSRASFEVRVETLGVLDAARSFQVISTVRGDRGKLVYVVDDGASVNTGDVLARFDATPFEADVLRLGGEVRAKETTPVHGGMEVGSLLRVIRQPHFGRIGTVVDLPPELHELESGSKARVMVVEFMDDKSRAVVPRANVELIEA